jgi:hypothetical protein
MIIHLMSPLGIRLSFTGPDRMSLWINGLLGFKKKPTEKWSWNSKGTLPRAHCTHEPHSASLLAGAYLFFPEVGESLRDGEEDTEKGRGRSVERCHAILKKMEWDPELPSNCFE